VAPHNRGAERQNQRGSHCTTIRIACGQRYPDTDPLTYCDTILRIADAFGYAHLVDEAEQRARTDKAAARCHNRT